MNTIAFSKLYTAAYTAESVYAEEQTWRDGALFCRTLPRPTTALIYLNGCTGVYTAHDGTSFFAPRGSLVCLPQGSVYNVLNKTSGADTPDAFLVECVLRSETGVLSFGSAPFLIARVNPYRVRTLMEDVMKAYGAPVRSPCALAAAVYALHACVSSEAFDASGNKAGALGPALAYLENDLTDGASVASLAAMCHLSEGCFRRTFKAYTGKSPVRFRIDARIDIAKRLLSGSDTPVERVASLAGFETSSYFCKTFKKETGMTPENYRKSH